jgi:hypothetical protein
MRHEFLLLSMMLLLFGPLFIPKSYQPYVEPILFLQTIFAAIILFTGRKIWRTAFILAFFVAILMHILSLFDQTNYSETVTGGLYFFFYFSVSIETYRQIYYAKEVNLGMIAAVFSGFILVCLMSSMFFMILETVHPKSFSNLGVQADKFQNLSYFSFITALTIGYGDITPLTMDAKKATMFVALIGNFYTVIVTGIIIGKFVNRNRLEKPDGDGTP